MACVLGLVGVLLVVLAVLIAVESKPSRDEDPMPRVMYG